MKKLMMCLLVVAALLAVLIPTAAADTTPVLTPRFPSVSFEGAVEYNIYFTVSNGGSLTLADMGLVTFWEKPEDGTVDNADAVIPGAVYDTLQGMYMVRSAGIPAKNLGDPLYCRIYARLSDGSYVYSKTFSYQTLTYAHGVLSGNGSETMKQMVADLLHYGASAQKYFNYKTDALMDRGVETNGHIYSDTWTVTTAPTLDAPGVESCLCTICGGAALTREVPALTISALQITTQPDKRHYYNGDTFDPSGMVVTALLSDGTDQIITDYTFDRSVLTPDNTRIAITYRNASAYVDITVSSYQRHTVSEIAALADETTFVVEGYVAGAAEEGPSTDKELLLKDPTTDDVIALRNIPYGSFPYYGYQKGDLVNLIVTVKLDGSVNTPDKRYLEVSAENGDQTQTVLSSGNEITYKLDNVITVTSWEEMQALFQTETVAEYSYIRLEGAVHFNRYAGSDEVDVSRIHMNAAATGVSGIRTDGNRTVSLRDNVMEANLGENWKALFFENEPAMGQYPGTRLTGSLVGIYTGGNNYYYQLTVLDEDWVRMEQYSNEEVLKAAAESYYNQGTQIQYDQTQSRRNLNPTAEMATAENTVFLDCSSYVNSVYQAAFGVNVMDNTKSPSTSNYIQYCQSGQGTAVDVMGYWVNADYTTTAAQQNLLTQVRDMLQVGDLLVYRHGETEGSSGHVYVCVGEDRFLHCTGSSYVYTDNPSESYDKGTTAEKTGGAIQWIDGDSIFTDTTNTRYLFKVTAADSVYSFGIIRPFNRGLPPSDAGKARLGIRGVIGELSVSAGQYHSVFVGDTLTYTVTLTNPSVSRVSDLNVTIPIPETLTVVTLPDGMVQSDGSLVWTGRVNGQSTVTLSFTAKVTAGEQVQLTGSMGTLPLNVLTNPISNFTANQLQQVVTKAESWKGKTFSDPMQPIVQIYQDALGVTISTRTTVTAALNDLIDKGNNTCRTDTALSSMLVPNLYGGLDIKSGNLTDNNRTRLPMETYFTEGDIILAQYDNVTEAFLYLGSGRLAKFSGGTCTIVTSSGDAFSGTNVFATLIAYDTYAVIRPGCDG